MKKSLKNDNNIDQKENIKNLDNNHDDNITKHNEITKDISPELKKDYTLPKYNINIKKENITKDNNIIENNEFIEEKNLQILNTDYIIFIGKYFKLSKNFTKY